MINKELLDIVAEHNFWFKDQDVGIEREELKEVMDLVEIKRLMLIITGVRRAGKTYLTKQILKKLIDSGIKPEQTFYVNFEDKDIEPFLSERILDDLIETYRHYINKDFAWVVFDEVHKVKNWEKWARTISEKNTNLKLIFSGSGSKIITPELSTLLTGRKVTYPLFPLSFKNFLNFKQTRRFLSKNIYLDSLTEYLEYGGLPLVVLMEKPNQKKYFLQEIYDDIITKDILLRYRLREEQILKKTAYLVLNSFSKYVSVRRIVNSLRSIMKMRVSPSTISDYLEYFESSFLFLFVSIFSPTIKDQLQYPRKVYCIDTGITNTVIPKFSENIGRICENVVAVELKRRNKEIYYWRDAHGREVDFVVKEGLNVRQLIQVTYASGKDEIEVREIKALVKASDLLKCKDLLVITWDYEGEEEIKGKRIRFMPLWKWLLKISFI